MVNLCRVSWDTDLLNLQIWDARLCSSFALVIRYCLSTWTSLFNIFLEAGFDFFLFNYCDFQYLDEYSVLLCLLCEVNASEASCGEQVHGLCVVSDRFSPTVVNYRASASSMCPQQAAVTLAVQLAPVLHPAQVSNPPVEVPPRQNKAAAELHQQ